jgi:excisionase family DNA binding protein
LSHGYVGSGGTLHAGAKTKMEKLLCSKREAAEILSVSVRTIENMMARKLLVSRRVGRRRLIPYTALTQVARRDVPIITGSQGKIELPVAEESTPTREERQ